MAQSSVIHVKNDKNPGTAFVMGLFVPGAGQMYNDQVELGVGVFALSAGLFVGGASIYNSKDYSNAGSVGRTLMLTGGTISFAAAVYAAFHSRKVNRDNGVDKRPLGSAQKVSLGPASDGIGLALAF